MDLYKALRLSSTSPLIDRDASLIIKAYTLQMLDLDNPIDSRQSMHDTELHMIEDFPAWGDFQLWVEDTRKTIAMGRSSQSLKMEGFTADRIVREVQELGDRLGAFQDIECRNLKARLAEIEYKSTGRVLLSDFYKAGWSGQYLFNEHTDFLRKLGALDESDVRHPTVIIANYLASQTNCLASTGFHSVCCIDECEGLMGHLERSIAAPIASPSRIAEVVSGLRSDTVDAPRNLSAPLMARLGEIADHHDGSVPLHGRLFAQWMHHAYPLECPYPHAAGTLTPLTPDEWMEEFGATEVEAPKEVRSRLMAPRDEVKEDLPWMAVEELVSAHNVPKKGSNSVSRKLVAFFAVVALAVPIARSVTAITTSL